MYPAAENSNDQAIDLSSLGENLLETYIKKGKESLLSKREIISYENMENDFPIFFKMLNTDVSKSDVKWIEEFNKAINEASEDQIKKFARPAIDMLTSIIYLLFTEKKNEKKQEKCVVDIKNDNDISKNRINSKDNDLKNHRCFDYDFEDDEILKELTEGLDPQYIDQDFNMIHSTAIKKNQFDDYTLFGDGTKIYKTQGDIH